MIRALAGGLLALAAGMAPAGEIRVATFNAALGRSAPGLLLKDLTAAELPRQVAAVVSVVAQARPDILLLNDIDYDGGDAALDALRARLAEAGIDYPHAFAAPSNTGLPSGQDLDGDGDAAGPRDAYGYGLFPGQNGMAVLSRFPIDRDATRTFQTLRWADFPGALLPVRADGSPFPSAAAQDAFRLSSRSHWDVAVDTPDGRLRLYASHPTPPVFDGPEDLNGRRNHDEVAFWSRYLAGDAFPDDQGRTAPRDGAPFVILGTLNADPEDGDGMRIAIRALLADPLVTDPRPRSDGGRAGGARATAAILRSTPRTGRGAIPGTCGSITCCRRSRSGSAVPASSGRPRPPGSRTRPTRRPITGWSGSISSGPDTRPLDAHRRRH